MHDARPLDRRIRLLGVRAGTLMRVDEAAALSSETARRRTLDLFDDGAGADDVAAARERIGRPASASG